MRTHFLYQFSIRIMIGSFLLASLVSGFAVAHFTAGSVAVDEAESSSRSIGEYRKDMKAFMKLSKNEDQQLQRNATYNLCELHAELVDDSRFDSSQQIQGFRATIAKRLENYSKEMKLKKKRADRAKKKQGLVANDQIAAGTRFTTRLPESQNNDSDDGHSADDMYSATSDSNDTMGQFTGGPNQFFGYAGGRFCATVGSWRRTFELDREHDQSVSLETQWWQRFNSILPTASSVGGWSLNASAGRNRLICSMRCVGRAVDFLKPMEQRRGRVLPLGGPFRQRREEFFRSRSRLEIGGFARQASKVLANSATRNLGNSHFPSHALHGVDFPCDV